jgi:hypothetical protein
MYYKKWHDYVVVQAILFSTVAPTRHDANGMIVFDEKLVIWLLTYKEEANRKRC